MLDSFETRSKNNILGPVKKAFTEGHKVEAIRTLKANGENCQLSWQPDLQAWVICSKNVALIAKTIEDVQLYTHQRFNFCKLMAGCWFNRISSFGKKELASLQNDMSNVTFIGEYIGHPDC
jgi:hypothetical protein